MLESIRHPVTPAFTGSLRCGTSPIASSSLPSLALATLDDLPDKVTTVEVKVSPSSGRRRYSESIRLLANTADMLFTMPFSPSGLFTASLASFILSTSPWKTMSTLW